MKTVSHFPVIPVILFHLLWNNLFVFSQPYSDALRNKLSIADQNRLLEADALEAKGHAIFSGSQNVSDLSKTRDQGAQKTKDKNITVYDLNHLDASVFFLYSNELKFKVLNKQIKEFWEKYKGDKKDLELVIKIEKMAYDSINRADELRKSANIERSVARKVPLLMHAEKMEDYALHKMEKLLYTYQSWSVQINSRWLNSDDASDPYLAASQKKTISYDIKTGIDTSGKKRIQIALGIYCKIDISEQQIDFFNDFLEKNYPDNTESEVIDFRKLAYVDIDSLRDRWHRYMVEGVVPLVSHKVSLLSNIEPVRNNGHDINKNARPSLKVTDINSVPAGKQKKNEGVQTTLDTAAGLTNKVSSIETFDNPELILPNFSYRIQISACRDQLSPEKLHRIYSGNEKILETYEDDWYKYIIGVVQNYQEARILRDKINVKGAFIVSYFNGKRIRITPSLINK